MDDDDGFVLISKKKTFVKRVPKNTPKRSNVWTYIQQLEDAEFEYLESAVKGHTIHENELTRLLNVYETDYNDFVLEPLSDEVKTIPYLYFGKRPPWKPYPSDTKTYPSITTKEEFFRRFPIFTENQLDGWTDWNNMVIVGGAVAGCLLPIPSAFQENEHDYFHKYAYPTSDIDIYFYGLNIQQFSEKLYRFYEFMKQKYEQVLVVKTPYTITLCTQYPKRHIQIVIGRWDNIKEILFEPDIGPSCVAFDGQNVYATKRAQFSYNYRCLVASERRYAVRGFPEYESRLIKYSKRGFVIWDPKLIWNNISPDYIKIAKIRLAEHKTVEGRAEVNGLRLLITLHNHKNELANVDILSSMSGDTNNAPQEDVHVYNNEGLPYGPNWNCESIRIKINEGVFCRSNYGPYQLDLNPMQLVDDIVNHESILHPHREKLIRLQTDVPKYEDYRYRMSWYQRIFKKDFKLERHPICD